MSVHEEYDPLVSLIGFLAKKDLCCGVAFQGQTRVPVNFASRYIK